MKNTISLNVEYIFQRKSFFLRPHHIAIRFRRNLYIKEASSKLTQPQAHKVIVRSVKVLRIIIIYTNLTIFAYWIIIFQQTKCCFSKEGKWKQFPTWNHAGLHAPNNSWTKLLISDEMHSIDTHLFLLILEYKRHRVCYLMCFYLRTNNSYFLNLVYFYNKHVYITISV